MTNLYQDIGQKRLLIDGAIKEFFDHKSKTSYSFINSKTLDFLSEYCLRNSGKRIRSYLVVLGYCLMGHKVNKEILKVAAAVELYHNYFLIHDDIIDQDTLRRGGKAMHLLFSDINVEDKKHFGEACGCVAGDLLSSLATDLFWQSEFSDKIKIKAFRILNEAIMCTCLGQQEDIYNSNRNDYLKVNPEQIIQTYKFKTANYTITAPLLLGACLGGARDSQLTQIFNCVEYLGIIFQIQDDVIDIFSTEQKIGKPIGSDIGEGKINYLIAVLLKKSDKQDQKRVVEILLSKKSDKKNIEQIKDLLIKYRILDDLKELIDNEYRKSMKMVNDLSFINHDGQELLREFIEYIRNLSKQYVNEK